jgi:hypothetical protein
MRKTFILYHWLIYYCRTKFFFLCIIIISQCFIFVKDVIKFFSNKMMSKASPLRLIWITFFMFITISLMLWLFHKFAIRYISVCSCWRTNDWRCFNVWRYLSNNYFFLLTWILAFLPSCTLWRERLYLALCLGAHFSYSLNLNIYLFNL